MGTTASAAKSELGSVKVVMPSAGSTRLDSVDLLRGLVMVIMALDHVRDYFSSDRFDITDPKYTTAALFLTRWITQFCAPVFVFLAGTGAYLSGARGKDKVELSWFLLTRGLWLVVLELTLVRFGWSFNLDYHDMGGAVIWAIGWSMVVLGYLVFLPTPVVTALGILMIVTHNLFDGIPAERFGSFGWLWAILHSGEMLEPLPGVHFAPAYPLVPWIGVMAAGYGFGTLLLQERAARRRALIDLGLVLTVAFVGLRALNVYGDPRPWSAEPPWFVVFSILNCWKYPPSLLYLLMTLGPAILALAWFDRQPGPLGRLLVTFGRVPLFYYLIHIPMIHALQVGIDLYRYGEAPYLNQPFYANVKVPSDYGFSLGWVYVIWLGIVVALYPVCKWYAGVKRRHPEGVLSYL
jgi:uncharacterized membrane protein